jgi:hypothetical protein
MGDPELRSDETVLVRTQAVYVKSIPFEGILTNKRIILVDRAKNLLPPKEIPLITIKEIESGENAIRDQILTLSVMAKTGETRQMILTFSRQAGGNRIKERDEWARIIRENTSTSFEQVIRKVIPGIEPPRKSEPPAQPRRMVTSAPVPPMSREPEGVHPVRKIVETPAPVAAPQAPPVPRAETQAATNSFCSQCGTKVPLNSAFCNRCGSPLAGPAPAPAPAPVPPYTQPAQPPAQQYTPPPAPAPASSSDALQQAALAFTKSAARPIDRDIQEVEPLIERSNVRIPPDPLRTVPPEISIPKSFSYDEEEPEPATAAPAAAPAGKQAAKGFISKLLPQKDKVTAQPKAAAGVFGMSSPPPKPPKGPGFLAGNKKTILYAVIAIVIIAVVGMVVYPMLSNGGTGQAAPTPTPPVTTIPIHIGTVVIPETTAPSIPATGVFVHVDYLGGYKGSYGMPDAMTIVPGNSGDRVWEVELANGTVNATFEKLDGSTHELLVEIFKDGATLSRGSTTIGHGSVALSVNVTTGVASAPVTSGGGTVTPAAQNQTAPAATSAASAVTATPVANSTTVVATTTSVTNVTTAATTAAVNTTTTTH